LLLELSIANFAIIESLQLQFGAGLSVLTGETGAGKSIVIDAVMLLLGGRASSEMVRTGCDRATIEGVFAPSPDLLASLSNVLDELGLSEGEELILRREVGRERRSICRINGRAVTLGTMEEIGRHLIDIHGQGDHLSLMQVRRHVDLLDRYGALMGQRQALGAQVQALRQVRDALRALRQDKREMARRADLLAYQIDEIAQASLQPDEEPTLKRQRILLGNAEKRLQLAARAHALLAGGEDRQRSITDLLAMASEHLSDLAALDESLKQESEQVESMLYQAEELARAVRAYRDEIEYDPRGIEAVEERLSLIQGLKRKYGDSIAEILAYGERAKAELDGITNSEERIEVLTREEARLLQEIAASGQALSQARKEAALRLSQAIEAELAALNMERARFVVDMRWDEDRLGAPVGGSHYRFDATGLDQVEFLVAPNLGEEPKPLVRIASGGETSRLMLALKTVLSHIDPVPTLIFDEIDAGIGGRTGSVVGHKLWTLACDHQVFCVTHLAQIARYGAQHYRIAKQEVGERTVSTAQLLGERERVEELAVLLGGAVTDNTLRSAQELLSARETGDRGVATPPENHSVQ
jgi:DNA repair protein RecN (Recombination protein N)